MLRIAPNLLKSNPRCPVSHDLTVFSFNEQNMDERRTGHRWDVSLDAVWNGKSGNYTARITDLSDGGCYMDSLGNVTMGELLNLKLQLPNGEWLELTGEV